MRYTEQSKIGLYSSFEHVLDGLHSYFYTITVSYDGFKKKYCGRIKAVEGDKQ